MRETAKPSSRNLIAFVLAAWMLTCAQGASAGPAFFSGLGFLPGGAPYSSATALSADASTVVGGGAYASMGEAVRWTMREGMVKLGDLPGGDNDSYALACSADGSVIVGTASSSQAFRWQDGVMTVLSGLPTYNNNNHATGVSADGSVIVGYNLGTWSGAFRWENGSLIRLPDLPAGGTTEAHGVSADGRVIVGLNVSGQGIEAFRWENGQIIGLGDLPGGQVVSAAWAISADGSTIVGTSAAHSFGTTYGNEGFRWTAQEGMVPLDPLGLYNEPKAVSADGSVIVGVGGSDAFVWDRLHGMRSLTALLVNQYGLDLTGWRLRDARGVSADGLTIVGRAFNPQGNEEAYIAHLPEPATLVLLLLAGSAFPTRRPRRS